MRKNSDYSISLCPWVYHPKTRAHVRLLGPCFKTGRVEGRPIRHRPCADGAHPDHPRKRSPDTVAQSLAVEHPGRARRPLRRRRLLGPQADRDTRGYNSQRRGANLPSSRPSDRAENRSWRSARGKCTRRTGVGRQESPIQISYLTLAPAIRAEFRGPTLRIHPFTSRRFHVLLNSLFKVLFNFPSRYLSAIGLVPVFSLRWSLPPTLGCIPKQPDSRDARSRPTRRQ